MVTDEKETVDRKLLKHVTNVIVMAVMYPVNILKYLWRKLITFLENSGGNYKHAVQLGGVIATFLVALIALFGPYLKEWYYSPELKIETPSYTPLRWGTRKECSNSRCQTFDCVHAEFLIVNDGRSVAKQSEVLVTAKWQKIGLPIPWLGKLYGGEKWEKKEEHWVPINLRWVSDFWASIANKKPTTEKNLVPNRPYPFRLGTVIEKSPGLFELALPELPTGEMVFHHGPGEFYFEVTAFADGVDPEIKYFYVNWEGAMTDDLERANYQKNMKDKLVVTARGSGPPF